jgi:hypothetical protein
MAKINKHALVMLALQRTFRELNAREKLCVLADMYVVRKGEDGKKVDEPRWYGNGGGTSGLEQGIYDHMTTFRRVSNLWAKLQTVSPGIKQDTFTLRDQLVAGLEDGLADQITEKEQ